MAKKWIGRVALRRSSLCAVDGGRLGCGRPDENGMGIAMHTAASRGREYRLADGQRVRAEITVTENTERR